jgi:hypothetical protein
MKCHAGLDPASKPMLDSRFCENDDHHNIVVYIKLKLPATSCGESPIVKENVYLLLAR